MCAAEPLVFSQNILPTVKITLAQILEDDVSAYLFSSVDLNGDGFNEYISKNVKTCEKICNFNILALNSEGVALNIGEIKAKSIQIEDVKHSGIRKIKAFGDVQNDFIQSLYIWDTGASQYILER